MRGFMTSDTFHGLLRDSAWSAPMFYFVVNPALHMVVSYLGSLIRKARGKKHEDTQDMCEYAIFFIASALVSTFVFATGSHFVASFPAVAPAPSDDHVKKSRDVHPEEQVDGRIVSGLQVMAGTFMSPTLIFELQGLICHTRLACGYSCPLLSLLDTYVLQQFNNSSK